MDRYQRVEKPKPESPIQENEIRITTQGLVRNYVSYGISLLQDKHAKEVTLKAMGQAISKAVVVVEFLKKQFPTLHQDTIVSSVNLTDVWEPLEEGLLTVETKRQVSMISITLSANALNKSSPGVCLRSDLIKARAESERFPAAMETPEKSNSHVLSVSSPSTPQAISSALRLWRPHAQRKLRTQWMKLSACRHQWDAASSGRRSESASNGRSEATALVNAYLSQLHMPKMKLGVLSDFPHIRENAMRKLFKQQEVLRSKLILTYRVLVSIVLEMISSTGEMRLSSQGADNSPIAQFSNCSDVSDGTGEFDGFPVYQHWSISRYEHLADEFIQMFKWELNIKRRLMVELLSFSSKKEHVSNSVSWVEELYPGEFEDLTRCEINITETPKDQVSNCQSSNHTTTRADPESTSKVMEVYLTAWISEVYLDADRLDEILNLVSSEIQVTIK